MSKPASPITDLIFPDFLISVCQYLFLCVHGPIDYIVSLFQLSESTPLLRQWREDVLCSSIVS